MTSFDTSYEGLVDVLARYVHTHWCVDEPNHIDTMCSSQFQIPAGVLRKVGILKAMDEVGRHYVFTGPPEDFKRLAAGNKEKGCSYDTVVLAMILVVGIGMGRNPDKTELIDRMRDLGLCELRRFKGPVPEQLREAIGAKNAREKSVLPHSGKDNRLEGTLQIEPMNTLPPTRYVWTEKKESFDKLRKNWPELIA